MEYRLPDGESNRQHLECQPDLAYSAELYACVRAFCYRHDNSLAARKIQAPLSFVVCIYALVVDGYCHRGGCSSYLSVYYCRLAALHLFPILRRNDYKGVMVCKSASRLMKEIQKDAGFVKAGIFLYYI